MCPGQVRFEARYQQRETEVVLAMALPDDSYATIIMFRTDPDHRMRVRITLSLDMKVFVFSARSHDRSSLQAASGTHELSSTDERLTVGTVEYVSGCSAVSIFIFDDASAPVLERLHAIGIRYVLLRSAGYDHRILTSAAIQEIAATTMRIALPD